MSTVKKTFCFFLICIPLHFSHIIGLASTFSILLNGKGDSDYIFPELRSIQYFTIEYEINCHSFIYAHYQADEIPYFS